MMLKSIPLPDFARPLEIPLAELTPPLDWTGLFGRPGPNAVEIGTGNGYFLESLAARAPHLNLIGIEREAEFYIKMVKRCARAGLANVRTTNLDAIELLNAWIPPGSLQYIYSNFSDPWPKRRHRERRVFGPALLPVIERLLEPGGEVWFKTDVGYYFNLTVTSFRERAGWRFLDIGRTPAPRIEQGEVVTNFERKAREAGREIWGFRATFAPA